MNITEFKNFLKGYKAGTFITVQTGWKKPSNVRSEFKDRLKKKSVYKSARLGVEYSSTKSVKALREIEALPVEPQPLPWGKWHQFPYIVEHKENFYARLYVKPENIEVQYMLDKKPVTKAEIAHMLRKSQPAKNTEMATLTTKIEELEI
jgi:hypothetical protein